MTPQERRSLDRQREALFAELTEAERQTALQAPPAVVADEVPLPTIIHMGGSVRRSDGTHSVWLNGVAIGEGDLPANTRLEFQRGLGVLRISTPSGELTVRPGQTLNATTGELREAYQLSPEQIAEVNAELARRAEAARPAASTVVASDTVEEEEPAEQDATLSQMESIVETLRLLQEAQSAQGVQP